MVNVDVIIFGGGIAGLWTLAKLTKLGFNAILLENTALGCGQTIKSQGIIHGGLKYALSGRISSAVSSLQDMPTLWQQCLAGNGEIDLANAKVLAKCQYLWSADRLIGGITTLFASNSLKSHVEVAAKEEWPSVMQYSSIQSKLYQLAELILDIPSVLKVLATQYADRCVKIDSYKLDLNEQGQIISITIKTGNANIEMRAQKYIFTAGSGNALITQHLADQPAMQMRPLHMVLVKCKNLMPLYGHCIGLNTVPRMTITTHTAHDNTLVWYLGGKIAEDGINRTVAAQIDQTKSELKALFPKLDLSAAEYATFMVDRAEAKQADGSKPSGVSVFKHKNYITAWPTKLALAPIMAQQIVAQLQAENIQPLTADKITTIDNLPQAAVAQPIWDQLL